MANKRIKDLATTKYKGFMALDDADGTGKMDVDTIFNNFAGKFVDNVTEAKAGKFYIHNGTLYQAKEDYTGVWDAGKFKSVPIGELIENIQENNIIDLLADYPYTINTSVHGITFVGDPATKTIHVSGTASDLTVENLIVSQTEMPAYLKAGDTISFEVSGMSSTSVFLRLYYYPNTLPNRDIKIAANTSFTIPSGCIGILLRLEVPNGTALPVGGVDVSFKFLNKISFSEIEKRFEEIEHFLTPLSSDEVSALASLLDAPAGRYFNATGSRIEALDSSIPFDLENAGNYLVQVFKYSSSYKIFIVTRMTGSEHYWGYTTALNPTTLTWVDLDDLKSVGFIPFVQADADNLGKILSVAHNLYRVYNSQANQTQAAKLCATSLTKEVFLTKGTESSAVNANILPIYGRYDDLSNWGGINYTWKDHKTIHVVGTASSLSAYNLIISRQKLIPGAEAGKDILFNLSNFPSSGVYVDIFVYKNNSTTASYSVSLNTTRFIRVPSDATGLMIRLSVSNATVIASPGVDLEIEVIANPRQKHLKVLCIGNSYTNDCTAYTPLVIENISKDVAITMGTAYYSGATINNYVSFFDNDTAVITYYKYNALSGRWNSGVSSQTIKQIVADEDWDVITFQQGSMYQGDWSTFANLNTLIDKIIGYNATLHTKPVKVGWLMPELRLSVIDSVTYDSVIDCVEKVLETTPIDFFIPCGTAVQNARGTSLNSIGNSGGLTADDAGHLQAGLPSLLASYVSALKLLELCGETQIGILQENTRPDSTWISAKNTPGENGTSTGVTDANCYLAQKCAVAAIKSPTAVSTIAE